ncbi:MAG: autotransporter assembly complex protein TamA [Bacteroidota bacterium]
MALVSAHSRHFTRAIESNAGDAKPWRRALKAGTSLLVASLVVIVLSGCQTINRTLFGEEDSSESERPEVEAPVTNPVAYEVRLEDDLPKATRDLIEQSSALMTQKHRPPASYAALSKRVDDDIGRFKDVLASEGYYEPDVEATIDADVEPAQVVVGIDPGALFHLQAVDIRYQPAEPVTTVPTTAADLGLGIGEAAAGAPLVEAERRLVRQLDENGYPNARIVGSQFLANRETKTITATWTVDTGPLARFGELRVDGLEAVDPEYVHRIAAWKPGTLYDIREIERVRSTLSKTRLFATITPPPREDVPVEDGIVPVTFEVSEGPPRSVGVGLYYSTDEQGPAGSLSWEHRNLFGSAESLRVRIEGSQIRQWAEADFRKPAFLDLDQTALANLRVERNDTDAYKGTTASGFAGLERRFLDHWSISAGPAFMYINIEQSAGEDRGDQFLLGGARTRLAYDSRDDKLDPTKGLNASLGLSPFTSMALTSTHYVTTEAALAGYQSAFENDRVVLAARGRIGSIYGSSRSLVPASQRFYAGGGGSVRGYKFQSIGPLDRNNDPLGGRSLVEVNAEARIRVIGPFGVVPFIDGGQVYEEIYPRLSSGDLQWAAGLGLRYYSPVGPIRFDVATPINPRGIDDPFQFYISIGQAF